MTIAADYFPATARVAPTLIVYVIEDGRRRDERRYEIKGKGEARKLAAYLGAEPWNF